MIIDSNNLGPTGANSGKPRQSTAVESKHSPTSIDSTATQDSVSLSSTGQAIASLEASVSKKPEVDVDKVNQLTTAIEQGTYRVNSNAIANKLLDEDRLF